MIALNHSLRQLAELGLLRSSEWRPLRRAGIEDVASILEIYNTKGNFDSIDHLENKGSERLTALAKYYLKVEGGTFTEQDLFNLEAYADDALFVPVQIDWKSLTPYKRQLFDTWALRKLANYEDPKIRAFFKRYLGEITSAEELYERAVVDPVRPNKRSVRDNTYALYLSYLIKACIQFYHALQFFDRPIELLKFIAWSDFQVPFDHDELKRTERLYKAGSFPFAQAVYQIIAATPYFNHRRRMKDINRIRFVSLFNDDPYTYEALSISNYMPREWFDARQNEANNFAENRCRYLVYMIKALGFKANYHQRSSWDNRFMSMDLVDEINEIEGPYLTQQYFAFLFNELYGTKFEFSRTMHFDGRRNLPVWVNMNF